METGINRPLKGGQLWRYHASQPPGGARQAIAQHDELGRVENISEGAESQQQLGDSRGSEKTPGGGFHARKGTQNKATRCQNGLRWTVNVSGLALALATHRWPAPARFAALWGFVEPLVDASGHARLHHSCFLLEAEVAQTSADLRSQ